jgi:hypothetical protein
MMAAQAEMYGNVHFDKHIMLSKCKLLRLAVWSPSLQELQLQQNVHTKVDY